MDSLDARLKPNLDSRKAQGIFREVPPSSELIGQPKRIDFSSNDYLSLSTSPQLKQAFIEKVQSFPRGLGTCGSRLLDGGTLEHALLEERIAAFFGSPAALLYTSGFDANVGFFAAIPSEGDVIIHDTLVHASAYDGMRASRAARLPGSLLPFDHNSILSLRSIIKSVLQTRPHLARGDGSVFVTIESLYSMDGDIAPLKEICEVVEGLLPHRNGHIIVDEAHATGVYGPNGRGLVAHLGLENRITARLHTFSKAIASNGAVLLTSKVVREYLINYSRPQIFTAAMSFGTIASLQVVFDVLEGNEYAPLSERLRELSLFFMEQLALYRFPSDMVRLPWNETPLFTPIIPLLSPFARPLALYLQEQGFQVRPVTHPAVPKGQDRLRLSLHVNNTKDQISALLGGIQTWIRSHNAHIANRL